MTFDHLEMSQVKKIYKDNVIQQFICQNSHLIKKLLNGVTLLKVTLGVTWTKLYIYIYIYIYIFEVGCTFFPPTKSKKLELYLQYHEFYYVGLINWKDACLEFWQAYRWITLLSNNRFDVRSLPTLKTNWCLGR